MKEQDPSNFPEGRKYIFSPNTGNSGLRVHVKKFHILNFLELAEKHGWPIFIQNVNLAFSIGYTFATLREALQKPGVSIRNLPPPPEPAPGDFRPQVPGGKPSLHDGLPEYSLAALQRYLVDFIVADDQVRRRPCFVDLVQTSRTVYKRC